MVKKTDLNMHTHKHAIQIKYKLHICCRLGHCKLYIYISKVCLFFRWAQLLYSQRLVLRVFYYICIINHLQILICCTYLLRLFYL